MPNTWTPQIQQVLAEAAADLVPYDDQAYLAGLHPRTYRRWRARAKQGEEPYSEIMIPIWAAEAKAKRAQIGEIRSVATGQHGGLPNWQASAWLLERRFPREYSVVSALRPEVTDDTRDTSREARMAALRAHWGRVAGDDDPGGGADDG